LYGPPTTLPWGISIEAEHRLAPWNDLAKFPVETTRFHPTFAYEMIWNLIMAGLLIYLITRKGDQLRTGVIAALSLIAAGIGRAWIELFFRPDQPHFFNLPVSTSFLLSVIFALVGLFILLVKTEKISVSFMQPGSTGYLKRPVRRPPVPRKTRREKI
jgi:phosphatidylglycerol:prolipoprotein diacylglycerol transferase